MSVDHQSWLLVPARSGLTFSNVPEQSVFISHVLTFFQPPPDDWLEQSHSTTFRSPPLVRVNQALKYAFQNLTQSTVFGLSSLAIKHLIFSLFAELNSQNI